MDLAVGTEVDVFENETGRRYEGVVEMVTPQGYVISESIKWGYSQEDTSVVVAPRRRKYSFDSRLNMPQEAKEKLLAKHNAIEIPFGDAERQNRLLIEALGGEVKANDNN